MKVCYVAPLANTVDSLTGGVGLDTWDQLKIPLTWALTFIKHNIQLSNRYERSIIRYISRNFI